MKSSELKPGTIFGYNGKTYLKTGPIGMVDSLVIMEDKSMWDSEMECDVEVEVIGIFTIRKVLKKKKHD